jgi:O-antigen ligase
MIERCRGALLVAAAAYLALLPTGTLSFWRSLAFAIGAAAAAALVVAERRQRERTLVLPDLAIPAAVAAWGLWSTASLAWSVDAAYTANELRADVAWGALAFAVFYVATLAPDGGFDRLASTALGALAFWTALACGLALSANGFDATPLHRGEGAFATYLVTFAPFVLLLCWPAPAGFATGRRSYLVAALLFGLVVVTARLSENRIVWLALAASLVVVAIAVRSRGTGRQRTAAVVALVVVFGVLFVDAARDRAAKLRTGDGSVAGAIASDPRIDIWKHARARIMERPWTGHGYGLHILGREIASDTGDARTMHPHNLFASQWLQTGAIGMALFVLMLAAVAARFVAFVRSGDGALARIGALGLAVLVGFIVRNLTDDFFTRANGKLLFAALAMLLAAGTMRAKDMRDRPAS